MTQLVNCKSEGSSHVCIVPVCLHTLPSRHADKAKNWRTCHSSYDRNNNVSFYTRKVNLGNLLVQIKTSLFLYKRIQVVNFFIEKKVL